MPHSKFYMRWHSVLFLFKSFYYCLVYPFEIAALNSVNSSIFSAYFSILVDIVFLTDFILKCFFLPYKDHIELELVFNRKKIFKNYFLRFETIFKVIAFLPVSYM